MNRKSPNEASTFPSEAGSIATNENSGPNKNQNKIMNGELKQTDALGTDKDNLAMPCAQPSQRTAVDEEMGRSGRSLIWVLNERDFAVAAQKLTNSADLALMVAHVLAGSILTIKTPFSRFETTDQ